MTTNGKGSMGEPSLGIQTKSLRYVPTTNCIPSNMSVSDGEEETLARQVWPLILSHTTLTRSIDVKILPYNAREGFHKATRDNGNPLQ